MGRWRRRSRQEPARNESLRAEMALDAAFAASAEGSEYLQPLQDDTTPPPSIEGSSNSLIEEEMSVGMTPVSSSSSLTSLAMASTDASTGSLNDARKQAAFQVEGDSAVARKSHVRRTSRSKKRIRNSSSGPLSADAGSTPLNAVDTERIRSYLTFYRDGALASAKSDGDSAPASVPASSSTVWIAGHAFPPLSSEVFSQPYIDLPSSLGPKQRRVVHDLCVEVGLYHCGAGNRVVENSRRVVVSVSLSGILQVPDLSPPMKIPVDRCRPWFFRGQEYHTRQMSNAHSFDGRRVNKWAEAVKAMNDDHFYDVIDEEDDEENDGDDDEEEDAVRKFFATPSRRRKESTTETTCRVSAHAREDTRRATAIVEKLLDQPGKCLRDDLDVLDFVALEKADLAATDSPTADEDSSWMYVDSREKMLKCVDEIMDMNTTELGFDVEAYNPSKYTQLTCLLQLATNNGRDYVIDVFAPGVWEAVPALAPIFADPNVVKIGHSISSIDCPSLHRDFGIFVVNVFDTYEAARTLRLKQASLLGLCEHYGLSTSEEFASLKRQYQAQDWRIRPLSKDMITYGRYDVHYLVKLRLLLMRDLTRPELWDGGATGEEGQLIAKVLASSIRSFMVQEDGVDDKGNQGAKPPVASGEDGAESSDDGGYVTADDDNMQDASEGLDTDGDSSDAQGEKGRRKTSFRAKDLRMNVELMRVITQSLQRSLSFWTDRTEPGMKNETLLNLVRRSVSLEAPWTDTNMTLYKNLIRWRENVAERHETMSGLICPLNFLVLVAYRRPTTVETMKSVTLFMPDMIEDESTGLVGELLALVLSLSDKDADDSSVNGEKKSTDDVGHDTDEKPGMTSRSLDLGSEQEAPSGDISEWSRSTLVMFGVSVVAVGAIVIMTITRSKKR